MSDLKDSFNTEKENILKEKDLNSNNLIENNLKILEFEKNILVLSTINNEKCEEINSILEEKKVLLGRYYMYTYLIYFVYVYV
jgi:hypothetical protein